MPRGFVEKPHTGSGTPPLLDQPNFGGDDGRDWERNRAVRNAFFGHFTSARVAGAFDVAAAIPERRRPSPIKAAPR